jgi:hypothetical protein
MFRNRLEAHALKELAHGLGIGRGVFNEFKASRAHWVIPILVALVVPSGGSCHLDLLQIGLTVEAQTSKFPAKSGQESCFIAVFMQNKRYGST